MKGGVGLTELKATRASRASATASCPCTWAWADRELQELKHSHGSRGLRAHQDLLDLLGCLDLMVLLEFKDHGTPLESTSYLKTPPKAQTKATAAVRAAPKGCRGYRAWPVARRRRETVASLV